MADIYEIQWRYGLITAMLMLLLNEFVFYKVFISTIFSVFFLLLMVFAAFFRRQWLLLLIFVGGLLFNTRPRELHLVDLELRGNFEYFSPNIIKIFGFTHSTLFYVFLLVVVLFWLGRNYRLSAFISEIELRFLQAMGLIIISSTFMAFFNETLNFRYIVQDLKFIIFVIIGFFLCKVLDLTPEKFIRLILWIGLTLGSLTFFNIIVDVIAGESKLSYNSSTLFSVAVFGFVIFRARTILSLKLLVYTLAAIPLTRGEMLSFGFTIFVLLGLAISQVSTGFNKTVIWRALLLLGITLAGVIYIIYLYSEPLFNFMAMKVLFFITADLSVDASSSIRTEELKAVFMIDKPIDVIQLLFGSGFGGGMSFDDSFIYALGNADFPAEQIRDNYFVQPHFFGTYYILKFGLIGTLLWLLVFIIPYFFAKNSHLRILYVFMSFCFLWESYWIPFYAIFLGVFISVLLRDGRDRVQVQTSHRS